MPANGPVDAIGLRRRGPRPIRKRLNLWLTVEQFDQVERIAEMRGLENGGAARELLAERLEQIAGRSRGRGRA
jgi:hypothetical protein